MHDDEPLRTAGGTLDERGEDLRPLRGAHGERLIDHRQADGAERTPLDRAREQDLRVPILPGAQQVTRAEQLGTGMVAHDRFSHEQAVEDEQADRVRPARKRAGRGPRAARNIDRASEEALTDLTYASRIEPASELRICFEKLYGAVTGVWHYERNPRRSKGAGIPTGPTCNVALRIPVWKDNGRGSPADGVLYCQRRPVAGWCNWQHTSLWIWELGFESLPGSLTGSVTIAERFNGPPGTGNGGYVCGLVAE